MQAARTYPKKKTQMFSRLREFSQGYKAIAIVKMEKVRATQLMPLRKKFRGEAQIMMVKNTITKKALADSKVKGMDKLLDSIDGQSVFIFSNLDPFKLYLTLDKNKIFLPAKGGDVATDDITVQAGNTALPPGPILSEFRESKVPTKIHEGTVWIAEDTVVAKTGDTISHKMASLLGKLSIKPIKAGMYINAALMDGVLYSKQDLSINVEDVLAELKASFGAALSLAINASYATTESIRHLLAKAFSDARALSTNAGYMTSETAKDVLYAAESKAMALHGIAKSKGYT